MPSAAITTIINPAAVKTTRYFAFYNDASGYVSSLLSQPEQAEKSGHLQDRKFSQQAPTNIPIGAIINPSALASAFFDDQVNVYGIIQSVKPAAAAAAVVTPGSKGCSCDDGPALICRLSPGFEVLDMASSYGLANNNAISACADRDGGLGYLFYNSKNLDNERFIQYFTLDGAENTPEGIKAEVTPAQNSFISVAYGKLGSSEDIWGAIQVRDRDIVIFSRHGHSTKTLDVKGVSGTPLACVFVGGCLVVYYFGNKGDGVGENDMPVWRAVLTDFEKDARTTQLAEAYSPDDSTQLSAITLPGATVDGKGKVVLTYVQAHSGTLVSYTDVLTGHDKAV